MAVLGCQTATVATPQAKSLYDFTMKDIDGKEIHLSKFKGKVVMVVNVASKCGLTPQYKSLEALYRENKEKGFVILGFPANNFGSQEPGTETEIKQFCSANYDVTFPMFSKISVKGDDTHPLYKWLLANSDRHEDVEWNFAKFIIGRDGKVMKRLSPKTTPDSEEVKDALGSALK
ncbi:MAG TPA: glutathione peroxidase [Fimbriimonas sp.]|nr:glutathione peroxidase [Fimbriimonas sp.]